MPVKSLADMGDAVETIDQWMDPSNPLYNLPLTVLFSGVASDVVAAVEFALANGLELSVKNSGQNYAGASTKKGTLMMNTQRYKKYTPTGVTECIPSEGAINQDLSNQACVLTLVKDKKAFTRVGGGGHWDDIYGSVRTFNEAQESFKYHPVGGAAPTVTLMG